ncbi:MAG: hypothetical protein Q8N63_03270 [Nanoarchaeota archaeon]|nr:hypothetical protein [Nanoarchaeota archaeon]
MDETQILSVSKDSQKFVKDLADLPTDEYHKVMNLLGALEKQQDAEANLESKRGWRYMWQRTPRPYLLMLAYLVFLAPVGGFGYQALSHVAENNQILFSVILLLILIIPLLVVFYLSYNYVKQQKTEASNNQINKNIEEHA